VAHLRALCGGGLILCLFAPAAAAQDSAPAPSTTGRAPGETSFLAENVTRAEAWRFFEPPQGGGTEPNYVFVGNRSTLGAHYAGRRWGLRGAIQYVRLENLPRGAIGPGLLGNGGAYYFQAAGTFSYQFYLRALSAAFTSASGGVTVEAGRFSFTPEATESPTDPAFALARSRLDGRLLGDMDGSLYQRAWDGVRVRAGRGAWRWTGAAVLPTQGTFEESANLPLDRVRILSGEVTVAPGGLADHTRVQAFAMAYRDTRRVRARPDNSGLMAQTADVTVATFGASAVGVYPRQAGAWDLVVWTAGQAGDWYGQSHRAWSALAEGGFHWTAAPGQPWVRAGVTYASGDGDGRDGRHGTFFPMLPSGDRFVRSNIYAVMNIVDAWTETRVTLHPRLEVVVGLHHVSLASDDDRWYLGSGATERRGNFFGFLGRNTRGASGLGTLAEADVAWQPTGWWTLRGYLAGVAGGDAVRALFVGDRLVTAAVESRFRF
jgi:hypothetical protein